MTNPDTKRALLRHVVATLAYRAAKTLRDAPAGFAEALTILDFSPTTDVRRGAALDTVLTGVRVKDALTLWHLLSRGTPEVCATRW